MMPPPDLRLTTAQQIDEIVAGLDAVNAPTASGDAVRWLGVNDARDRTPIMQLASWRALDRASRHEAAHAQVALQAGWPIIRLTLRPDASGVCVVRNDDRSDYASDRQKITFALAGMAANLREHFPSVTHGFDTISARLQIDQLNSRAVGPYVSSAMAAAEAVAFVDLHWAAIENVGLVLLDAREITGADVELFSRCRR